MDDEIPPFRKLISFADLVAMGWPYCRVHTMRLMRIGRAPVALKLGPERNSHLRWFLDEWPPFLETQRWVPGPDDEPPDTAP